MPQHLSIRTQTLLLIIASLSARARAGDVPPTTPAERQESWQRHRELERESPFRDLKWQALGPRMQGGRIECIACPPGYTGTIYVGAGSGNLWKTVNNGTTWEAVFEKESTFAMGDVAVSRTDPDTVWLGTGEVLMARSSYAGTGVFKSTDAGRSWRNMGLHDSHHVAKVVIDSGDADLVYVAAIGHLYTPNEERGVFRTTDGGETWKRVLYIDERTGAIDLVQHPSERRRLYAAMWERSRRAWNHDDYGPGSGLYRSSDGGETWSELTEGLPQGPQVGRIGVDVAASNPEVVYAIFACRDDSSGVYRSADGGESWTKVHRDRVRAHYDFCTVKVSPDDENQIYVPGVKSLHSLDGGKTYRQIGGTLVHLLEHGSRVLHLDAHAFWIDPLNPDRILLGNDGGLHISYDRTRSWLHLNNLPIAEFYAIGYDMATPYNIYGGTQDNAALHGPSDHRPRDDGEDAWKHVYLDPWGGGDSYFTYLDPTDGTSIYYEHQFGVLRRKNMKTGESRNIQPRSPEGEPPLRYNWMAPFVISAHDPATLYFGANRLLKSRNRGEDWEAISGVLSTPGPERQGKVPYGTITSISESPLGRGLLYAGTDDGKVHVTRDDGASWKEIDAGLPDRWVSRVAASPHREGTVFVSLTGYRDDEFSAWVYRSDDHGENWKSLRGNLPAESVNVIREDPAHRDLLYLGSDLGVYTSLDGGTSWHSLSSGLPTTSVHDLFVHPRENELVIGTHGRSAFLLDARPIQEKAREK